MDRAELLLRSEVQVNRRVPVGRLLVVHLLLDAGSNAPQDGLGLSKLLDLLGGALMVGVLMRPQLADADGWRRLVDWRQLVSYAQSVF